MQNLVYLILLALPLYLVKFSILSIPTTVLEILIYVFAIWFVVYSLVKKELLKKIVSFIKNPFFIPLLVFFIAGVISVFVSPNKESALGIFKAYFFDASLFFFLFVSTINDAKQIKKALLALLVSAVALSLIGLIQYLFLPQYLQEGRIRSVFSSPNYLSLYITPISFLVFTFLAKIKKKWWSTILLLVGYIVVLLTIALTSSRGAWLGLLLGMVFLVVMLILQKLKSKGLRLLFVILFVVGFIASFFFIIKGSYAFGLVPENRVYQSDNIRKEIWSTSLDIGLKHPLLGIGMGNFQNYFGEYTRTRINYPEYIKPNAVTPHNIFFNIWLQTGLLGLLGLLAILVVFFVKCFKGFKKEFLINTILLASMIAIIGQGLVDSAIWKNDLMILFWFIIGVSYIINRERKSK